jgi:hypothetical protein
LTVAEQNLSNTEVRMRCAGLSVVDIELTLAQQHAFFQFLVDPGKASKLDDLNRQASPRAMVCHAQSYFDPLPIWRNYSGRSLSLFSEYDDATPSQLAMTRLLGSPVTTFFVARCPASGLAERGAVQGGVE